MNYLKMKNYFISGLLLIGVFHSCNNNEDEIIKTEESSIIETPLNNPNYKRLSLEEQAELYKNTKDKEKFLDEIQQTIAEPLNRTFYHNMLSSSNPIEFVSKNFQMIDPNNEHQLKELCDPNEKSPSIQSRSNSRESKIFSNSKYPDFESSRYQELTEDLIENLEDMADVDYTSHFKAGIRVAEALRKQKKWSDAPRRPDAVYVGDHRHYIGGRPIDPFTKFDWDRAEVKMEVRPPSKSKYNSLVKNTNIGPWRIISDLRPYSDEVHINGKETVVKSPTYIKKSETQVTISNEFSISSSAKVGFEAGVIFAKGSLEVSVEAGYKRSKSTNTIESSDQRFQTQETVGPGESIEFFPCERRKVLKYSVKTPLRFRGLVGMDFGRKTHGHYFWGIHPRLFYHETQREDFEVDLKETTYIEYRIIKVLYDKNGRYKSNADRINHDLIASGSY
jgi:hypothetical protein